MTTYTVETHFDHPKYNTLFAPHEAGYDAFLTAKVLIRLSAELEAAGTYVKEQAPPNSSDDEEYETAPEESGVSTDVAQKLRESTPAKKTRNAEALTPSEADVVHQGVSLDKAMTKPAQTPSPRAKKLKRKTKKATPVESPMERSAFSHATRFDLLGDLPSDEEQIIEPPYVALRGGSEGAKPVAEAPFLPEFETRRKNMMPPFQSDFWRVYGNKLRVFGTVENVCDLTKS